MLAGLRAPGHDGLDEIPERVLLVATELATNVLQHEQPPTAPADPAQHVVGTGATSGSRRPRPGQRPVDLDLLMVRGPAFRHVPDLPGG